VMQLSCSTRAIFLHSQQDSTSILFNFIFTPIIGGCFATLAQLAKASVHPLLLVEDQLTLKTAHHRCLVRPVALHQPFGTA
jgi:hypothetical protein